MWAPSRFRAPMCAGVASRAPVPPRPVAKLRSSALKGSCLAVNATHVVHSGVSGNKGGGDANPTFLEDLPNESASYHQDHPVDAAIYLRAYDPGLEATRGGRSARHQCPHRGQMGSARPVGWRASSMHRRGHALNRVGSPQPWKRPSWRCVAPASPPGRSARHGGRFNGDGG